MVGMFNTAELSVLKCVNCSFIGLDLETWQYPYSQKDYYTNIDDSDVNPRRPFILRRVDFVKKYAEGRRLLELGCGLGETAIALSRSGFDVYGVEESRNATEFLKERFGNVKWACSDIKSFLANNCIWRIGKAEREKMGILITSSRQLFWCKVLASSF